ADQRGAAGAVGRDVGGRSADDLQQRPDGDDVEAEGDRIRTVAGRAGDDLERGPAGRGAGGEVDGGGAVGVGLDVLPVELGAGGVAVLEPEVDARVADLSAGVAGGGDLDRPLVLQV